MKRFALYLGIAAGLVASCSTQEKDFQTPQQEDVIYYASFEQPCEDGTRVYANEDLLLRWTADDRVSIFGKNTYNQQYKFLGETGDNSGGFSKVDGPEYVTGNPISHTVSVYPYQASTKITEDEVINLTLPAEQVYAENTFGLGSNTMVSVSEDNVLQYKNVGGYLMLKLYGEGVSVSSITIVGNQYERIAGNALVTMPLDGTPITEMTYNATAEITLTCTTPVQLGAKAIESNQFWFVVPPICFCDGFTIIVKSVTGEVFLKSTTNSITIERNCLSKMSPIKVELSIPNNVIVYTTSDGKTIPYRMDNWVIFGGNNTYLGGIGIIRFSEDLETIGDYMFSGCTSLTSITLPDSVTSIGDYAFSGCTSLTNINLPDGVTSIGDYAFSGCTSLTNINLPDSVTSIGDYAFSGCTNLTSITLPDGVTSIGEGAFKNCASLTSMTLPDSVTDVGNSAFSGCTSLMSFYGKYASSDGLFLINQGSIIAAIYRLVDGSISIPDGVTSIGDYVFNDWSCLTSITLPNSVTSIGNHAFSNCMCLASITLPDSVISIGDYAFNQCTSLLSITLPDSVTSIGDCAFNKCTSISNVILSKNLISIGESAFFNCSRLTNVDLPESLITIGNWAFWKTGLRSIAIPNGVTELNYAVFGNCFYLTDITIPDSVTRIGGMAFYNAPLSSIILPKNLVSIEYSAFSGCSRLTSIDFPETLRSIEEDAFRGCSSLSSVTIPDGVTLSGFCIFFGCSSLTEVVFPQSLTTIGEGWFAYCSSLETIRIPPQVTELGYGAFYNCNNLKSVTLESESVVSLVKSGNLQIGGVATELAVFENTNDCPIYVPSGCVNAYKTSQSWNEYSDRIQAIPE